MPPSLSELKVTPSFCFAFKIPDNVTATSKYSLDSSNIKIAANVIKPMKNFTFDFTDYPGNGYETVEFHKQIIAR